MIEINPSRNNSIYSFSIALNKLELRDPKNYIPKQLRKLNFIRYSFDPEIFQAYSSLKLSSFDNTTY